MLQKKLNKFFYVAFLTPLYGVYTEGLVFQADTVQLVKC